MATQFKTPVIDLVCQQGSTFFEDFEVTNAAGTKDITGYFARGKVRTNHASASVVETFVGTVTDPINGIVRIELTADQTRTIPAVYPKTLYRYDVEIFQGTPETVFRIAEGKFAVTPEITR